MDHFCSKQLDLLSKEHLAEIEERKIDCLLNSLSTLQRKGLVLSKLKVHLLKTGLYGRTISSFVSKSKGATLQSNVITAGDIVEIHSSDTLLKCSELPSGVVIKCKDDKVSVAFDGTNVRDFLDELQTKHRSVLLVKVANEVTYKRLKTSLENLRKYSSGPSSDLVNVVFNASKPSMCSNPMPISEILFCNKTLNKQQREAVCFALNQREIAAVHGPPGTGKTTTVVEIILQLLRFDQKVLLCAPSNVAVDNLVEKLSCVEFAHRVSGIRTQPVLVRLGHPARMLATEAVVTSLDARVASSDGAQIVRDVRNDIEAVQRKLKSCRSGGERHTLREERRALFSELRQRENKCVKEIFSAAHVVLATNVGAHEKGALRHLAEIDHFDVVVIDECAQALEASCWIPMLQGRKCILAGDHLQLPPTIISKRAAEDGLAESLLERVISLHGSDVTRMLTTQYRMNAVLMRWASDQMYEGRLVADDSVENHLLRDMDGVEDCEITSTPMMLIDTSGCDMRHEFQPEESESKGNEYEVELVDRHVASLIEAGLPPQHIAVISPYNLQVDLLRNRIHPQHPKIEIKSVDGFQGREKEAVVMSMVRSNTRREIGFVADRRRLNVAVTRARRHFAIVGDCDTLSHHPFIKSLIDHVHKFGHVLSAFEYDEYDVTTDYITGRLHSMKVEEEQSVRKHHHATTNERKSPALMDGHVTPNERNSPALTDDEGEGRKEMTIEEIHDVIEHFIAAHSCSLTSSSCRSPCSQLVSCGVEVTPRGEMVFPATLSAHARKMVHETCEARNLRHYSEGQRSRRRVRIARDVITPTPDVTIPTHDVITPAHDVTTPMYGVATAVNEQVSDGTFNDAEVEDCTKFIAADRKCAQKIDVESASATPDVDRAPASSSKARDDDVTSPATSSHAEGAEMSECSLCKRVLPTSNLIIHKSHCERAIRIKSMREQATERDDEERKKDNDTKRRKKKKGKAVDDGGSSRTDSTDDWLVDAAISSNRVCGHKSCGVSVVTLGQRCEHCKASFCFTHLLPEVHGCGRVASDASRRRFIHDGKLGPARKQPAKVQRDMMKVKLDKKLREMGEKRRGRKKGGD